MTQDDVIEMAREACLFYMDYIRVDSMKQLEDFAHLVADKATKEANATANASWTLMCKKMVAIEREAYEHDMEVLMNALWKACGDDEEVVNATIESQGELTKAKGEQA
jgi:hypothetical protein